MYIYIILFYKCRTWFEAIYQQIKNKPVIKWEFHIKGSYFYYYKKHSDGNKRNRCDSYQWFSVHCAELKGSIAFGVEVTVSEGRGVEHKSDLIDTFCALFVLIYCFIRCEWFVKFLNSQTLWMWKQGTNCMSWCHVSN